MSAAAASSLIIQMEPIRMLTLQHGRKENVEIRTAVQLGLIKVVEWFYEQDKYIIFTVSHNRRTLLHSAAEGGSLHAFKWLLAKGLNAQQRDSYQLTWLHVAVEENQFKFIQSLGDYIQEFISTPDINQMTPLLYAAEGGYYNIFSFLLERGASLAEKDVNGKSAIHFAAEGGHSSIIAMLLDKGVSISEKDGKGRTALHFLAQEGYFGLIEHYEHLFKTHNGHTLRDNQNRSPVYYATQGGNLKIVQWLLQQDSELDISVANECLLVAAYAGQLDIIQWVAPLLESLFVLDENLKTILHIAAQNGHLHVVEWLLTQPIELVEEFYAHSDADFNSALHLAVRGGYLGIIEKLSSDGAFIFDLNGEKETILHSAVQEGYLDVVEWILVNLELYRGFFLTQKDINGCTVLHKATENGFLRIMEILLIYGASIEEKDEKGRTILHIAVCESYFEIVEWLLEERGGNYICAKDHLHSTALDNALDRGFYRMVKALITSPWFDLNQKNDQEVMTLIYNTAKKGHHAVLQLFLRHLVDKHLLIRNEDNVIEEVNPSKYTTIIWQKDTQSKTVFHHASEANQRRIFELLVYHFSMIRNTSVEQIIEEVSKLKDNQNKTPIHYAAEKSPGIARFMLSRYPPCAKIRDAQGRYPLHYAVRGNQIITVHNLVHRDPHCIKEKDFLGMTALHFAAQKGFLDLTRYLIAQKADLTVRTLDKRSVLDVAYSAGSLQIYRDTAQFIYCEYMRQNLKVSMSLIRGFEDEKRKEISYHIYFFKILLELGLNAHIPLLIDKYHRDKLFVFFNMIELTSIYNEAQTQLGGNIDPVTCAIHPEGRSSMGKTKISNGLRFTVFGSGNPLRRLISLSPYSYENLKDESENPSVESTYS